MSIFGDLDAETVTTNPFFIAAGDYTAQVTDAKFKENKDKERVLHLEYTITSPDSEYLGVKTIQSFTLPADDLNQEKLALLPVEERKAILKTIGSMKKTLCGSNPERGYRGLGVPASDLNDADWDPAVLKGVNINIGIRNWGNDGVNVQWVNYDEDNN